jgi:DNA polymerase III subunit chi
MSEVFFYHLTSTSVEAALPLLLEKVIERGLKALIISADEQKIKKLDAHLWSYDANAFLPHGFDNAEHQPILLSDTSTPVNKADMIFLLYLQDIPENTHDFTRTCLLFSGQDPDELDHARSQWKAAKERGLNATYFQQTDTGGWVKK